LPDKEGDIVILILFPVDFLYEKREKGRLIAGAMTQGRQGCGNEEGVALIEMVSDVLSGALLCWPGLILK